MVDVSSHEWAWSGLTKVLHNKKCWSFGQLLIFRVLAEKLQELKLKAGCLACRLKKTLEQTQSKPGIPEPNATIAELIRMSRNAVLQKEKWAASSISWSRLEQSLMMRSAFGMASMLGKCTLSAAKSLMMSDLLKSFFTWGLQLIFCLAGLARWLCPLLYKTW